VTSWCQKNPNKVHWCKKDVTERDTDFKRVTYDWDCNKGINNPKGVLSGVTRTIYIYIYIYIYTLVRIM
jgi:PKD repeat protein